MGKKVTSYKVTSLNKVNTTLYNEGDIFMTNRSVGILTNGKIETFNTRSPNLKDYVKREEVHKMIDEALKKGAEDGE